MRFVRSSSPPDRSILVGAHTLVWWRNCACAGMTLDPAYASFTEDILGSITPGKFADFVVLSQDIMTIPASDVLSTRVVATVMDGKPVYGAI